MSGDWNSLSEILQHAVMQRV